jgi:hypothetical protein
VEHKGRSVCNRTIARRRHVFFKFVSYLEEVEGRKRSLSVISDERDLHIDLAQNTL